MEKSLGYYIARIWLVFSTATSLISLSSITDSLIAWSDFIVRLIISYRQIRDLIWNSLFSFINVNPPTWVSDYLTINSIFSISLIWAMTEAGKASGSAKLSSVFLYIKNSLFDFKISLSVVKRFKDEAVEYLNKIGFKSDSNQVLLINSINTRVINFYSTLKFLFCTSVFIFSILLFSFVSPFIIRFNDLCDEHLAYWEMRKIRNYVRKIPIAPLYNYELLRSYDIAISTFASFVAMNEIFFNKLISSILQYLAVVAFLFLILIFINQLFLI